MANTVDGIISRVVASVKRLFRAEEKDNQRTLQLENVRLLHELEQRVEQLSVLNETGRVLASSLRTEELVDKIHQQVSHLMDVDNLYIALYDYASDTVSFPLAFKGGQQQHIASRQAGAGLTEYIIQSQQALLFKRQADERPLYLDPVSPAFQEISLPSCSWLGVPMIASDQSVGVIAVQHVEREEAYAEDDLEILSTIASQAAVAIANARLYEQTDQALSWRVHELSMARDRLQAVLDATREGMMMLDTSGQIVFANAMFGKLFNTSPPELTGRKLLDVVAEHAASMDDVQTALMEVIYETLGELANQSKAVHKGEIAVTHPPRFMERISVPVLGESELTVGRLLTLRDITEEKNAAVLREEMTDMMVHDLRSPLTTILGGLQVLEYSLSDEQHLRAVHVALSGSRRLLNLIDALLDINKMEAGPVPLKCQELDWAWLVSEAVERITPLATAEGVALQIQLEANLPGIYADENLLLRVLGNLLDNALKYSPPGTAIQVSVNSSQGNRGRPETLCRVSDAGPGIAPEHHQHIFNKFFQVPDNTARRKGSGLGLAFCRLAVEAHGGRIWVESAPGQGSSFAFTLPADTAARESLDKADPKAG
ncbi:MAG: GAF domain-containing protein [Thermoflexales bacterium]|nr:GAF domain-containing protein [Thermoflexales bacterium]